MAALPTDLRSRLENTVKEARWITEEGARQALEALAVPRHEPHGSMAPEQRTLRNRLRAHGRQLGDPLDARTGTQSIARLVREVAYEHWHRMLFARFLAENHLLIEPVSAVAITMEEVGDLARERREEPWALAASFAQEMLPQIFRSGDPTLALALPPETRQELQRLLAELPRGVFTEDDSLGWTYQFWQSAEKDAVNIRAKSGEKITGETLPAVTQLFTEPYMVQFLLHNTIGAWHAGRKLSRDLLKKASSEAELRKAVGLTPAGGYEFSYLRFAREPREGSGGGEPNAPWRPAAGTFPGWPRTARELKVLDPCCGSGHFLVAVFELLVRLRMEEEGLDLAGAVRAVIGENLFGLELDPRCTQIAAFNLALAAWRLVGSPIDLPSMKIACSGVGPQVPKGKWLALAEEVVVADRRKRSAGDESGLSEALRGGLGALYDLFQKAPELGSLIEPASGSQLDVLRTDFGALEPILDAILRQEEAGEDEVERAVAAKGMAEAARILVGPKGGYTLVTTNVPYLGRGSHTDEFRAWADRYYKEAKHDLATVFVDRMLRWVRCGSSAGTVAAVTPQNWLFLTSYKKLRERLLKERTWEMVARLGPRAFETISGEVVNVALVLLTGSRAPEEHAMAGIDVIAARAPGDKAALLRGDAMPPEPFGAENAAAPDAREGQQEDSEEETSGHGAGVVRLVPQAEQLRNPDARVLFTAPAAGGLLWAHADSYEGMTPGDQERFVTQFWEVDTCGSEWERFVGVAIRAADWAGREKMIRWEGGSGPIQTDGIATIKGRAAWGRRGVRVHQMGVMGCTLYDGELFDKNGASVVPNKEQTLPALYAFCQSSLFRESVRKVDRTLKITVKSFMKVPFDLPQWQKVAQEKYPHGLPEPYSDDPTQWLFHGHPAHADAGTELHVAVARLLGYRWPAELDPEMRLSEAARALVRQSKELDAAGISDDDGIVCISPVRGEPPAGDRLRSILAAAFGGEWSGGKERSLLAAAAEAPHGSGRRRSSLDDWLREAFFEEHCKLFHHRPFVWHVWDGLRDGFNALVNYHRLAGPDGLGRRTLEALTYTYLGEWIDRQRAAQQSGQEGADARLAAAFAFKRSFMASWRGSRPTISSCGGSPSPSSRWAGIPTSTTECG
jgi:hypothetical protein